MKMSQLMLACSLFVCGSVSAEGTTDGGFYLAAESGEPIAHFYLEDDTPRITSDDDGKSSVVFNGMRLIVIGTPTAPNDGTRWHILQTSQKRVLMCRIDSFTTINKPYCWALRDGMDLVISMGAG